MGGANGLEFAYSWRFKDDFSRTWIDNRKKDYGDWNLRLGRAGGEAAVEIHGQALIEDDGDVTGTGLHFARGPDRDAGNLGSAELLKFRYGAIVEGKFLEPRAALFQFGGQFVA